MRVCGYFSVLLQTALDAACETVWWVMTGSNRRPTPCKGAALPTELITRFANLLLRFPQAIITMLRSVRSGPPDSKLFQTVPYPASPLV